MPLRKRYSIHNSLIFFLTTSTFKHHKFPGYPNCLKVIREILFRTAKDKNVKIMAYAIMPNHLHLIAGSLSGGMQISKFMHSLKGRIRETLQGKGKFWQDRFDDVILFSEKQFYTKLNYIHNNPVKAGIVKRPEQWEYSSYNNWINGISDNSICIDFKWCEGNSN